MKLEYVVGNELYFDFTGDLKIVDASTEVTAVEVFKATVLCSQYT
jgi:hypothetical protein